LRLNSDVQVASEIAKSCHSLKQTTVSGCAPAGRQVGPLVRVIAAESKSARVASVTFLKAGIVARIWPENLEWIAARVIIRGKAGCGY
jgi:hypothetical protein